MPYFVCGYYMNFATTRAVMAKLQIDDRGVFDDHLEFPINDWLAEQGKLTILAGAIAHPTKRTSFLEDGILLITRSIQERRNATFSEADVTEREADKKTREWLVSEGGAKADEIEFVCLWDDFALTRNGFAPRRNEVKGRRLPPKILTEEDLARWMSTGGGTIPTISISEFFKNEDIEGWNHSNGGDPPTMTFDEYVVMKRAQEQAAATKLEAAEAKNI